MKGKRATTTTTTDDDDGRLDGEVFASRPFLALAVIVACIITGHVYKYMYIMNPNHTHT